jgi:hypothetical protein
MPWLCSSRLSSVEGRGRREGEGRGLVSARREVEGAESRARPPPPQQPAASRALTLAPVQVQSVHIGELCDAPAPAHSGQAVPDEGQLSTGQLLSLRCSPAVPQSISPALQSSQLLLCIPARSPLRHNALVVEGEGCQLPLGAALAALAASAPQLLGGPGIAPEEVCVLAPRLHAYPAELMAAPLRLLGALHVIAALVLLNDLGAARALLGVLQHPGGTGAISQLPAVPAPALCAAGWHMGRAQTAEAEGVPSCAGH